MQGAASQLDVPVLSKLEPPTAQSPAAGVHLHIPDAVPDATVRRFYLRTSFRTLQTQHQAHMDTGSGASPASSSRILHRDSTTSKLVFCK